MNGRCLYLFVFLFRLFLTFDALPCYEYFTSSTQYLEELKYDRMESVECEPGREICSVMRIANDSMYAVILGCTDLSNTVYNCLAATLHSETDDFIHCWDINPQLWFPSQQAFIKGRMCCCAGNHCNKIENVRTFDSLIPFDAIHTATLRTFYTYWYSMCMTSCVFCGIAATVLIYNIIISYTSPEKEDDAAWQDQPVWRPKEGKVSWTEDSEEEEEEVKVPVRISKKVIKEKAQSESATIKKKTRRRLKKKPVKPKTISMETQETQEELTGNESDGKEGKKEDKKENEVKEKEKEEKKNEKTSEEEKEGEKTEKKKEEKKKESEGGSFFNLPKGPRRLANGRMQYVSMINENSSYSDD